MHVHYCDDVLTFFFVHLFFVSPFFFLDTCTGAGNDSSSAGINDGSAGDTKWSSVPRSIVKILWSAWRPSLFWVLDSGGR